MPQLTPSFLARPLKALEESNSTMYRCAMTVDDSVVLPIREEMSTAAETTEAMTARVTTGDREKSMISTLNQRGLNERALNERGYLCELCVMIRWYWFSRGEGELNEMASCGAHSLEASSFLAAKYRPLKLVGDQNGRCGFGRYVLGWPLDI